MSRSVVRASYLIFYQIIFRFLLTLYKQCNHGVDTLILPLFFFLSFLSLVSCTLFVHATCNFHINLRHISAVVVFFFLLSLILFCFFQKLVLYFFRVLSLCSLVILNVKFFPLFYRTRTLLFEK